MSTSSWSINRRNKRAAGWNAVTFASPVTLTSGTQYWLCAFDTTTSASVGIGQTSVGSGNGLIYMNTAWPTAPTTFTRGGFVVGNNLSAYLGTASPSVTPGQFFFSANRPRLPALAALGAVGWVIGRRNRVGRGVAPKWRRSSKSGIIVPSTHVSEKDHD